ncbi:MAG: hypothetical protein P8Y36_07315 [Alphaproteobacteria bacterium]
MKLIPIWLPILSLFSGFPDSIRDMANDTIMIRKKRAEMRKKMKMKMGGGHK